MSLDAQTAEEVTMASSYDTALELYYRWRPGAIDAYNKYILQRTPSELMADMNLILAPDLPKLMISDTQPVRICDDKAVELPGSPGHAVATDQYAGYIEFVPGGALVKNGDAVTPVDDQEAAIPYTGAAKVDGTTLVHVKLTATR